MGLVSELIADIRVEIHDTDSTRFTNDTTEILPLVKQAIRRANRICQRSQLAFAKKSASLVTVATQNYVDIPVDLDVPIGLYRDDLHHKLRQQNENDWEQLLTPDEIAYWFLDLQNSKILLSSTPQSVINLTLWYYPLLVTTSLTTNSTMPWDGRLDDIIAKYVALRLQNIEEMNTSADQAVLQDMESTIVATYAPLAPLTLQMSGWL